MILAHAIPAVKPAPAFAIVFHPSMVRRNASFGHGLAKARPEKRTGYTVADLAHAKGACPATAPTAAEARARYLDSTYSGEEKGIADRYGVTLAEARRMDMEAREDVMDAYHVAEDAEDVGTFDPAWTRPSADREDAMQAFEAETFVDDYLAAVGPMMVCPTCQDAEGGDPCPQCGAGSFNALVPSPVPSRKPRPTTIRQRNRAARKAALAVAV